MKVDVVDDLAVVGLCAALEQQARQFIAVRMRRTAFLAFADDADQRGVTAIAGHEVCVGVCAMIEQQARDRDGIVVGLRERQAGEAEIEEGRPIFAAEVGQEIIAATCAGAIGPRGERLAFASWGCSTQDALDLLDLAAHHRGVEAVTRDPWILFQNPHRGMSRHAMRREAADVMVGAGAFKEASDQCGASVLRPGGGRQGALRAPV